MIKYINSKGENLQMKNREIKEVAIVGSAFDVIKEKLENSSRANKNFAFLLISFTTYLLITTISIKDVQLLFPELGIQLPILNITLPLNAYMIVAPLILASLYINMLLNLYEHIKLIQFYKELSEKEEHKKAHQKPILPFMIDYAYINPDKSSSVFRAIFYFILFTFPLIVLAIIFLRFSDYQNLYFSGFDMLLLLIATICLIKLLRALKNRKLATKKSFILPLFLLVVTTIYFGFYIHFLLKPIESKLLSLEYSFLKPIISIKSNEKLPLPDISNYTNYLKDIKSLTKEDLNITLNRYSVPSLDLSGRNLIGADLRGAFLPFVDLERANLTNAYLWFANLTN